MINPFIRLKASNGKQYMININHIICVERLDNQYAIHLANDIIVTNTDVEALFDRLSN